MTLLRNPLRCPRAAQADECDSCSSSDLRATKIEAQGEPFGACQKLDRDGY